MRPYAIPPGTTLRSALFDLLPAEHARRVPPGSPSPRYCAVVKVRGEGGGTFTVTVDGRSLTVTEGESADRQLWLVTDAPSLMRILADASGARELVPREVKWEPLVEIPTDPRLVSRLLMMNGRLIVAMTGVPGTPSRLWAAIGCGPKAIRHVDENEPDAMVEVPYDVARQMGAGRLDAETASRSGRFQITGSRMMAMQFTLVLSMLGPARR